MLLVKARVQNFRSIDNAGVVEIDKDVTVFVGQNESGKTAFLKALALSRSVKATDKFDIDRDYPRKSLNNYRKTHEKGPAVVTELTYKLSDQDIKAVNTLLGVAYLDSLEFTLNHHFKNNFAISLYVDEGPFVAHLLKDSRLTLDLRSKLGNVKTVRSFISALDAEDLNGDGQEYRTALKARFMPIGNEWDHLLTHQIWTKYLSTRIPKFFYFDDYYLMPGKVNLPALALRAANPSQLTEEDHTLLGLFKLADVSLEELTNTQGYEQIKARLEGLSISITDKIFKYWKQNQELDVEFDIRPDAADQPPFNNGANLYIRIKSRKHRVSLPVSLRSKGFIWFFSFIVWFDTIQRQGTGNQLILLLDEPGLNLHALAQRDFLGYIDDLAELHQILYTTHSPFMIRGDRLQRVRLVEDRTSVGTIVTSSLSGSDPRTVFPLQAALGYTVAQNLLISKRNLLVGGPGDLVYLRFFTSVLEAANRTGLRNDIAIVPAGGLEKLATFIALLGANQPDLVIVHDWAAKPGPHLDSLVREELIKDKSVLHYGLFRAVTAKGKSSGTPAPLSAATSVEDLFAIPFYLKLFSSTFEKQLGGEVKEADLPPGDRILDRLDRHLKDNGIFLRPSGGFNHYAVANHLVANPPKTLDKDTLVRFEALFNKVNSLVSPAD